jgi:hypothetical protein
MHQSMSHNASQTGSMTQAQAVDAFYLRIRERRTVCHTLDA